MGINIEHYRATIGRFYNHFGTKSLLANLFFWHIIFPNFVVLNWVVPNILHQCNDIESNPGPTLGSTALHSPTNYEICHINMRSVKRPWLLIQTDPTILGLIQLLKWIC